MDDIQLDEKTMTFIMDFLSPDMASELMDTMLECPPEKNELDAWMTLLAKAKAILTQAE